MEALFYARIPYGTDVPETYMKLVPVCIQRWCSNDIRSRFYGASPLQYVIATLAVLGRDFGSCHPHEERDEEETHKHDEAENKLPLLHGVKTHLDRSLRSLVMVGGGDVLGEVAEQVVEAVTQASYHRSVRRNRVSARAFEESVLLHVD